MASSPTSRERDTAAAVVVEEEEVGDAQPRPEWIMLAAVPDVRRSSRMFPPGTDFVLALKKPPHVSHITVPARIAPGQATPTRFPYVVGVDAGGAFLLYVTHRATEPPLATGADASVRACRREFARVPVYFICDAHTGAASRIPDPPVGRPLGDFHGVGLISRPCGGGGVAYVVAELVPLLGLGTDHATLRRCWSDTGVWLSKEVKYAGPGHPESWENDAVISHAQKLWWVDLSCGLLACDPFTEHPALLFVPLPDGCVPPAAGTENDLIKHSRVTSSGGKLRYVQIHSRLGVPIISVWMLADPEHATWECECNLPFTEIWTRRWVSKITRKKGLMVAAAHPVHTHVFFFIHRKIMFTVDVKARRMVRCTDVHVTECHPSCFVHAWPLNQSLKTEEHDASANSSVEIIQVSAHSEPVQLNYQQVPKAKEDRFEPQPDDVQKEERKCANWKRHGLAMKSKRANRI